MKSLVQVAILAGAISLVLGLAAGWLGRRSRLQSARKLGTHRPRVSALGGPGFLCAALVGLAVLPYRAAPDRFLSAAEMITRGWGIVLALVFMFLWGLSLDGKHPRRHRPVLLLGHLLAGGVLFASGFRIGELSLGRWVFATGPLNLPLTLLWVVFVINFVRFFDGIDGLPAFVGLVVVAVHLLGVGAEEHFVHLLCAVFGGALVGLLLVTVYPARVYLGYNGSSLPGICLAALTLASRSKSFTTATIFIPAAVLIVAAAFAFLLFVESRILFRRGRAQP